MSVRGVLAIGAFAVVGVGLVLGFLRVGSPEHNRELARDARKVDAIERLVEYRYRDRKVYPGAYDGAASIATDVRSTIAYVKLASHAYELCTTFALPGDGRNDDTYEYIQEDPHWKHPAGPCCYHFNGGIITPTNGPPSANAEATSVTP